MTDLTVPPADRATCGWLPLPAGPPPLPAGPPPGPAPDRTGIQPAGPDTRALGLTAPAPATATAATGPPTDGDAPEPAAVHAAIQTLTSWLRSGGTLVCSSDDGSPHPGCALPPAGAGPVPAPPPARPRARGQRDGPPAGPPGTTEPSAAACRPCRASEDPVAVRAWARERGFRVADRGRLPAAVVAAYVAAHPHA